MRFSTLEQWLAWQERLHPSAIDLGLERCTEVARRMGLHRSACPVVTVAGTNGKGSCVMLLEASLRAAGHHTGAYISPHLHHYRERIRVDGHEVDDAELVASFARIDEMRGDISLTFFEFGTLTALDLFSRAKTDVVLLEVGLGGRLDAVNVIDADYALIASVGVDHVEWLGSTREAVGAEKAGVLRPGQPAVYAERDIPVSVMARARTLGTVLHRLGVDYDYSLEGDGLEGDGLEGDGWRWWTDAGSRLDDLPAPRLSGAHQHQNAAAVLTLLDLMRPMLPVDEQALRAGILGAFLPGRVERIGAGTPRILDVAHNPQAAAVLAACLDASRGAGRTLACLGMLEDKDVAGCVSALAAQVDAWFTAGLPGPRAQSGERLAARVRAVVNEPVHGFDDVHGAYQAALAEARNGDRVVVLGSFLTVAAVRALESCRS